MQEVVGLPAGVSLMHGGFGSHGAGRASGSDTAVEAEIATLTEALERRKVDFMAADGGSTDAGPYYLGSGESMTHREGIKQSLGAVLPIAVGSGTPLIIGSCAMAGTRSGLDLFKELVLEVAKEQDLHFTLGLMDSELDKEFVERKRVDGRIHALPRVGDLTAEDIEQASHIVAMQGTEPIIDMLNKGADVVLCGRQSDAGMFAAVPIMKGMPLAQSWHMAKVIDHGFTNVEPVPGVDTSVYGIAREDSFSVEATDPRGRVDRMRVAHAAVYENNNPFQMYEPPGMLDITNAKFIQAAPDRVDVTGSEFVTRDYTVKIEGATLVGYRSVSIAGVRDPDLIGQIDSFIEICRERVHAQAATQGIDPGSYELLFRIYGENGVMVAREPKGRPEGHEICIIAEAVAPSQEIANALMNMAHYHLLHYDYPGRKHTTGNMAFPYSPSDIACGQVYRFSVWHVMELDNPLESCSIEIQKI